MKEILRRGLWRDGDLGAVLAERRHRRLSGHALAASINIYNL